MTTPTLRISRQQLAAFLKNDHDAIRQFETLFSTVANPDTTATATEPEIQIETAGHQALDRVERLERAVQMLELAPAAGDPGIQATSTPAAANHFGISWPIDNSAVDIGWGDEFATNTIANWTLVNSSAFDSYGIDTAGGYLYGVPNTADPVWCGFFKSISDTSWTVIAKFRNSGSGASYQILGLSARNSSTGKSVHVVICGSGGSAYCSWAVYSAYNSRSSFNDAGTWIGCGGVPYYVKLVRASDVLYLYVSSDGRNWWLRYTVSSIAALMTSIDQVGIVMGSGGSSPHPTMMCDWVRRTA